MNINSDVKNILTNIISDVVPILNEQQRRLFLGSIAKAVGRGGIAFVNETSHCSRNTIVNGKKEIDVINNNIDKSLSPKKDLKSSRIRKEGGGRKSTKDKCPNLFSYIEEVIESSTYGNPMKVIHYTTLSLRKIADELKKAFNIEVSRNVVSRSLEEMGYSKQQNQKMYQVNEEYPDRDKQFRYIDDTANDYISKGYPVISVDTKKKENIGNFKNNGSEYRKAKDPRKVLDHDFPLEELGKVNPYGVYVLNNNTGFVNLGVSHDTSEFAGKSVALWWHTVGKNTFKNTTQLYITCDGGGSNSVRKWLWKYELQKLANETGLTIHVSHFPPGTSKWNKIEHRLFCYISKNWEGKPLVDIQTVVNLIGSTTTKKELKVICKVDNNYYKTGKSITPEQKEEINIEYVGPHKEWNYIIYPNQKVK